MNSKYQDTSIFKHQNHTINMEQLKKWIEVEGKMMDSVEFTRFIRERVEPKIERMENKMIAEEKKNRLRLQQLA